MLPPDPLTLCLEVETDLMMLGRENNSGLEHSFWLAWRGGRRVELKGGLALAQL